MTEYDGNQMELKQLSGGGWPGTAVGDAPMVEQGICSTEGNAAVQQEEQPLVLDLSGLSAAGTERENLSNYQIIAAGFFAQTREPALTISGNKVGVNAAAARLFPEEDYMEILINPEEKKVAFKPCDEYNIAGYRWAKTKDGKRYATQRTGLPFVLCVCQIMGWNPNHRLLNLCGAEDVLLIFQSLRFRIEIITQNRRFRKSFDKIAAFVTKIDYMPCFFCASYPWQLRAMDRSVKVARLLFI